LHSYTQFEAALQLLDGRLSVASAPPYRIVVCGGTALFAMGLLTRGTRDVDIVALADDSTVLIDPAPLPLPLQLAAREVAGDLGLPGDWLNNGPSSGDGGLFRLGLPDGLAERLTWRRFGEHLAVGFVSRYDQIHFKLYAAVDQSGGYHAADLHALKPKDDELVAAAAWSRSHDPSPGYRQGLIAFLEDFGHGHLSDLI
jgi:hypothetical protein